MSYSQNNEEAVILDLFAASQPGCFLDVGAWDGRTFSNTLRLAELGWGGVCVEPSPSSFNALLRLHADNPKIEVVNCAIGTDCVLTEFYDSGGDAVSTSNLPHKRKWEQNAGVKFRRYWLQTLTFEKLFAKLGKAYAFINIDVEGCNLDILRALPLGDLPATKVLCVEHDSMNNTIWRHAATFGFEQVALNGENIVLSR